MTIKWSAQNLTVNQPQPHISDDEGIFSVAGDKKISVVHEPASLATTGYTFTPGYTFTGKCAFGTRIMYANCATVTLTMVADEGATLAEFRAAKGDITEFAIPAGAIKAYIHITAADGGLNLIVGSC